LTTPIQLEIVPSSRLTWLAVLFHAGAMVAVAFGLPIWLTLLLALAVLLSLLGTLASLRQSGPDAVTRVEVRSDGRANWTTRAGLEQSGILAQSAFVSPLLIIVRLVPADSGQSRSRLLLLAGDSSRPDSIRRLKGWLRWRPQDPVMKPHAPK
jgi:hypothetical protein